MKIFLAFSLFLAMTSSASAVSFTGKDAQMIECAANSAALALTAQKYGVATTREATTIINNAAAALAYHLNINQGFAGDLILNRADKRTRQGYSYEQMANEYARTNQWCQRHFW